jgi:hypothetical protein
VPVVKAIVIATIPAIDRLAWQMLKRRATVLSQNRVCLFFLSQEASLKKSTTLSRSPLAKQRRKPIRRLRNIMEERWSVELYCEGTPYLKSTS